MNIWEQKNRKQKKYADWLHKEIEEFYGKKCDPKDMYYRNGDIRMAFEEGWDACMKHLAEIPWDKAMTEIVDYAKANSKNKKV